MAYQRSPNHISPQPPMDPYSPSYSPIAYTSPTSFNHQQVFYQPQALSPIQVDDAQYDPNIHPYWRDRVVPRPGFRSPRALGPTQESSRIVIKAPIKPNESGSKQLLPPRSFGSPNQTKRQNKETKETKSKSPEIKPLPGKNHGLDKYAPSFVPQSLRNIQRLIHQLEPLPPVSPFPPSDYSNSFLLPHLVESRESQLLSRPPLSLEEYIPFDASHYHEHWYPILQAEVDCLCTQRSAVVLWNVTDLKLTDWKRSQFSLVVPGLRENYPRLDAGDLVKMRQVIASKNGFTEPFFGTGIAFEARVVASQKREGLVHLYSPTLEEYIQNYFTGIALYLAQTKDHIPFQLPLTFNISFLVNARPFCLMEAAVTDLHGAINVGLEDNLTTKWLFPTIKDITTTPPRWIADSGAPQNDLKWKDRDLNEEQKNAITSVVLRQWPVPYLISGPAGTGKTRTIVEAVLQILSVQPDACILLCAPSNPATDTLVLRLRTSLSPSQMFRLNDHGRAINSVPARIMPYCNIDTSAENKFSIPTFKELMKYRVVTCSCVDANILAQAQCTNRALMRMENEVISSIHPHSTPAPAAKPHWTHLIIDEAAQGSEPEFCIPISVVAADVQVHATGPSAGPGAQLSQPQLILCGDRHQLGPIVSSDEARKAELDMSLLQRLFERPLYANEAATIEHFRPRAHLRKNYRSHPVILMPPSALFYNDTLVPFASNGKMSWSGLPDNRLPVRIIGCESEEECIDEKSTWYNLGEIEVVMRTVRSLMKEANACDPPLKARNIGIISPFRAQVWKMREMLREEGLRDVDVGTVEDWQGRENRVIIVSCVRYNSRFLEDDFQKGLGLFQEPKRMNVAITRAKELLVIIGNPQLLQQDSYWKPYLQFALRNNLYEGPELDLDVDGNYISKLEASLVHNETGGAVDPEKIGVVIAGIVAGEVLRE
ncbi:P-loop containing nucleoside triphosphate hydrolase protein [Macrolepiota fuliginosa MF-IS2]|uniref:P-loop containing nucleoside triphosphate hydrolase protein n=1 Tax=Macrolepiota fuliginosa MF-IS2 TaxID=1400762 RepID=A0A9P5XI22_9AGAR|nr:P-loop containing nucleoside triphosphate hydrolase protein [Macrolepiota fuliginosa MF-IS2]